MQNMINKAQNDKYYMFSLKCRIYQKQNNTKSEGNYQRNRRMEKKRRKVNEGGGQIDKAQVYYICVKILP